MQAARSATKPSKQRKMIYEAPAHVRHKLLASHLSSELRATHLVRSLPVKSGDTVRVVRGDHKGFEGKISRVELKKYRIYLEGLTREKVDGTTVFVAVHPSKLIITHLNLDDKWRRKILERKQKAQTKPKETRKKAKPIPSKKAAETVELEKPVEKKIEEKVVAEKIPELELEQQLEEEKEVRPEKPAKTQAEKLKRKRTTKPLTKEKKKPEEEKKRVRRRTSKKTEQREE